MKLSYVQFEVLFLVYQGSDGIQPNSIYSALPQFSKEVIISETNNLLSHQCLYWENELLQVTEIGIVALEQYRVKRAVIVAAGFGSRMLPVTETVPKPLVSVNGKRFIETQIDALLNAGITDITVVRGYKAEKFDALLAQYPMLSFIENSEYATKNNIQSAYLARHKLEDAYLIESDLFINNLSIIRPFEYRTHFCGTAVAETNDWHFLVRDDAIVSCKFGQQTSCYQYIGLSFWTAGHGKMLALDLEEALKKEKNHQHFYEAIPFDFFKHRYHLYMRTLNNDDVIEVDTYQELQTLDSSYR